MNRLLLGVVGAFWGASNLAMATDFYWNGSGAINVVGSWGTNTNGTGTAPTTFSSTANQVFNIQNAQSATLGSSWTISGSGSKLVVQNGGSFSAGGINPTFTLDLNSGGTYIATSTFSNLIYGTISSGSTFNYQGTSGGFQPSGTFGGLIWNSSTGTSTPGSFSTSGNFTVGANIIQIVNNTATSNTWTIGGDVTINSTTTLSLAQSSASSTGNSTLNIAGGLTNNGTLLKGASSVGPALIDFNGSGASNVTWGTTSGGSFNVAIESGKTITFLDNLSVSSGTLTVSGTLTTSSTKTATVGTTVLSGGTINGSGTVSSGTSYDLRSGTVSAVLNGAASVSKTTGGSVTLSGANGFTGGTTISAGTLTLANASALSGVGTTTVSGGTLSSSVANTTLGGNLTMTSGTINPNGTGVGSFTLAANKNLSFTGGTVSLSLLGATTSDRFLGSGTGTFGLSNTIFSLDVTSGSFGGYGVVYSILSGFASGTIGSGITFTGYDTVNYAAAINSSGDLSFTAIPEPSTYAALIGAISLLGVTVYRRRRLPSEN